MEPTRDALPGAWARLKQDVSCGLRRGAWYRVVGLTPEDAVLQVPRRERVRVPLRYLQTLSEIAVENNSTVIFPLPLDLVQPFLAMQERIREG